MKTIKCNTEIITDSTIKLTKSEAENLGIDLTKIEDGQIRGEAVNVGPWNICKSYKALTLTKEYDKTKMFTTVKEITIFGMRTLTNVRQGGYELEGYVSIKGKKYTAFTSSQLFEIDGKLINIAVNFARINK